jgi:UDP-GlcNAc:undecaprenyl-phosphate/decaprenyl-phosphate GlcNAc-1-phosphate transferase
MILYLSAFLIALAASALLTPRVRNVAIAHGLLAPPASRRHLHTKPLPRLGGVAIFFAFLIALAALIPISSLRHGSFSPRHLLGILIPACIVFLLGVYDDVRPVKPKSKIAVQSIAAVLLYFAGFGLHYSNSFFTAFGVDLIGLPLTVFWVLLITNAFNLIDGLDGLAAGSALVSAMAIFVMALFGHNDVVAVAVIALAGAILGFLPCNFYPASVFMGDSGSLFIGFLLSALALEGPVKTHSMAGIAIPLLIFGLPILDVTLAIVRRFLRGQSPFEGDADHVHHKLLKRGLTQPQAVRILYGVTAAFGAASLVLIPGDKLLVPVLLVVAIAIWLGIRELHYAEFSRRPGTLHSPSQHRQIIADQANIRRATESLESCTDFRGICNVLQENLQPIGFDGIRVKNLGKNGFPPTSLAPLQYDSDDRLLFTWSPRKKDEQPACEYHLELAIGSQPTSGSVSLFRISNDEDFQLELDILSEDFTTALSNAVGRATSRMKAVRQGTQTSQAARAVTARSSVESA